MTAHDKTSKSGKENARPHREPRWRPLLLIVLLLGNLVYLVLGILLTTQNTNSFRLRENILDELIYDRIHMDNTYSENSTIKVRRLKCLGWRNTGGCSPNGVREPAKDQDCDSKIADGASGYCEVEDEDTHEVFQVMKRTCAKLKPRGMFRCSDAPGFFNFRAETQEVINMTLAPGFTVPDANRSNYTQGIVMVVYPELIASAYATIRTLRDILACGLPIEIWFRPDEVHGVDNALDPLERLARNGSAGGITFREINDPQAVRFRAKIYAIYHSHFEQVLFLDTDNVPVRDPSYLFKTPAFNQTGALFWPDYWHPQNTIFLINDQSLVWQLLDIPYVDMFEQESGQLLIDRRRHAAALEVVAFYANHRPDYFSLLALAWGDKDLFRFAWLKLGASFYMIETLPSVAGRYFGNVFCGMTMVQHDPEGDVIFLHRNQMKLTGKPKNKPSPTALNSTIDNYPDPAMWTHVVSFRNSSARSSYIIQGHWESQLSDKRKCFGPSELDQNPNFYTQNFADLTFASLETHLRRFAMESMQFNA